MIRQTISFKSTEWKNKKVKRKDHFGRGNRWNFEIAALWKIEKLIPFFPAVFVVVADFRNETSAQVERGNHGIWISRVNSTSRILLTSSRSRTSYSGN